MIRQFLKNAGFLAFIEIILRLKGFIFIPLLTRHFGTVNYGVWSQVGVLIGTLSPLLIIGTDAAVIRYLPGRPLQEQKRWFSSWCLFLLGTSTAVCSVLIWFKVPISDFFFGNARQYAGIIPLAAAYLLTNFAVTVLRNWFRIQNNARIFGLAAVSQSFLSVVALVIMLLRQEGVQALILYTLIADLMTAVWLMTMVSRDYGWGRPDLSVIKPLIRYGLPLLPAGYAMWGLNSMDRLFLVQYAAMADIGIYSLVYSLGYLIIQVFVNPIWSMYPNTAAELFNQGRMEELQHLFDHSTGLIILVTVPTLVGMFVLGERILLFLATPEFLAGAPLMSLLTCGYLFHMLSSYYDISLGLVNRQYFSTLSIVLAFGINLVLNILLIPRYSIAGAAVATSVAFLGQFLFSYVLVRCYTPIRSALLWPLKIVMIACLMGCGVYVLGLLMDSRGLGTLILLALAGAGLYGVLLTAFGVIDRKTVLNIVSVIKEGCLGYATR